MKTCDECGGERKRGGRLCSACYQRAYRATPSGHERVIAAVTAYNRRNPAKRRVWVHHWQERVGIRAPDLQDLRRAIKSLDAAVQTAEERARVRGTGEPGGDGDPERPD